MPLDPDAAKAFFTALAHMGLLDPGESPVLTPLTGGVSSDIVRADLRRGAVCIKRALPKLKVKADWQAPVERNRWEVEWMRVVAQVLPQAVPRILGVDAALGMFAMSYLGADAYPVWKALLRDGTIDTRFATAVGDALGRIHAFGAQHPNLRERFDTGHIFFPIRLEPYLIATGQAHPDLATRLDALARRTYATQLTLVHGDVSPKNILRGPDGPIFLDAECAWFGDPAFDVAFCLNHMLLKCVWRPQWSARYLDCYAALLDAYVRHVAWESRATLEARVAELLPALFLARVDGKSPAEYIVDDWQRDAVRRVARPLIADPVSNPAVIAERWAREAATWR